jgi:alanine racemase
MNLTMVEVTGIPEVKAGDRVTLLGADGDERISAEELAAWADTISYEVYCLMGAANLRRYQGA